MKLSSKDIFDILKKNSLTPRFIEDLRGDSDHYHATIESKEFKGLSKVQQHKIVYDALGNHMGTTLHALMLTTKAT